MSNWDGAALPPGWANATLGDVVGVLDSLRVPVNAEERARRVGAVPYYGATGQVGWIDDHLFDEELVLLGEDGAPFLDAFKPKAYVIRGKAWVNNHAHVLRGTALLNPLLMHQLNAVDYHGSVTGTTRLKLPQRPMRSIPVVVPPRSEQARIVAEIEKQFSRLDAAVAALKRVQANLKRYRAAVLKSACEGPWPLVKLGSLVDSMKNGIYRARDAYVDDGIACLRMYNIESGRIAWKDVKRMRLTREEVRDYGLLPGDLLVNRVNSRELVGKAAPIPEGLEPCVYESKNIRVRLIRDLVDPRFVGFAMCVYGPPHFNRNAQQVVGMASISQPQIAALCVPLPSLAEQQRIVAEVERRLSVVEQTEAFVEANLQRADRLRQAILKHAFEGKLVPQDPNDEPASALIERIRLASGARQSPMALSKIRGGRGGNRGRRQVSSRWPRQMDNAPNRHRSAVE